MIILHMMRRSLIVGVLNGMLKRGLHVTILRRSRRFPEQIPRLIHLNQKIAVINDESTLVPDQADSYDTVIYNIRDYSHPMRTCFSNATRVLYVNSDHNTVAYCSFVSKFPRCREIWFHQNCSHPEWIEAIIRWYNHFTIHSDLQGKIYLAGEQPRAVEIEIGHILKSDIVKFYHNNLMIAYLDSISSSDN